MINLDFHTAGLLFVTLLSLIAAGHIVVLSLNSISNFVRIGENEFDRCSVNFTNRFPIFSATEEYGLDCHAVSRLAALRRVYGLQRLCPRVLSNQRHSHLFYLLVLFSTPLFYPQVPSMDRCRIRSVLSPDDCSNGPLVHSLRSVRFRIRTFLLNLIFRVSHFRNCQRRKQFQNSERNSVSFTAPGLMLIGIAFVLISCCGFVGLDSYGG